MNRTAGFFTIGLLFGMAAWTAWSGHCPTLIAAWALFAAGAWLAAEERR